MKIPSVKGFHDVLPDESARWQAPLEVVSPKRVWEGEERDAHGGVRLEPAQDEGSVT